VSRDRVLRPLFQHACIKDGKLAAFKVSAELLTSMSWQLFASDRTRPAWMAENIKSQRVSQLIANWKKSHLSLHGTFFLSWKSTDMNELCKESYYYYYYYYCRMHWGFASVSKLRLVTACKCTQCSQKLRFNRVHCIIGWLNCLVKFEMESGDTEEKVSALRLPVE